MTSERKARSHPKKIASRRRSRSLKLAAAVLGVSTVGAYGIRRSLRKRRGRSGRKSNRR